MEGVLIGILVVAWLVLVGATVALAFAVVISTRNLGRQLAPENLRKHEGQLGWALVAPVASSVMTLDAVASLVYSQLDASNVRLVAAYVVLVVAGIVSVFLIRPAIRAERAQILSHLEASH